MLGKRLGQCSIGPLLVACLALAGLAFGVGVSAQAGPVGRIDAVQGPDAAGIEIIPTSLTVTEGATAAAYYSIGLTGRPQNTVVIYINPDDQTMTDFALLVFHQGNWKEPQIVTVAAVDDQVAESQHTGTIHHSVSSQDPDYAAIQPDDVIVSIEDNDVAGVEIAPLEARVSEPLGTALLSFSLTSQPVISLTLSLTASSGQCEVSPTALIFDSSNWSESLSASVSAVDDAVDDGDQVCWIRTGPISSSDPMYDGMDPEDIDVTVEDDDVAGITISPTRLTISEPSGWAVFTMTLNSEPTAAVTIPLVPSNDECTVSSDSVTLQRISWQTDVSMKVTARDDNLTDGRQTCIVHTEPAISNDPKYRNLDPDDVEITVEDNETGWLVYLPISIRSWPPRPGAPVLQPIQNAGGIGSYHVIWGRVASSETYVLEEATSAAFSAPIELYAGAETSFYITGRGAARYHYRVKALNDWGSSAWSAVQAVDVLWEAEPNDAVILANGPIVAGQTYYGAFPANDDENDYYVIDLAAPQRVELWLRNIPAGSNYDLILRGDDVGWPIVGYSGEIGNSDEHIRTASPLEAGRYYIQIFNRWATDSGEPYHLAYSP